jgi:hypothetical protein
LDVGHVSQDGLIPLYIPTSEWAPIWHAKYYASKRRLASVRRDYRTFLFDELRSAPNAILSNEDLSYFSAASVEQLRADLEDLGFQEFHIVLYVRDPADYFLSMLHSVLKLSLGTSPSGHDPATFHYDFLRTADTWEQTFPGSVEVRHYRHDPDFDVVQDFSSVMVGRFGMTIPLRSVRANTSLSAEGLKIMQDYRLAFWPDNGGVATPDAVRLYEMLARSTTDVAQTKPVLKPVVAECIRANHLADAEKLKTRYGVDLGLQGANPHHSLRPGGAMKVAEIVESVDPGVVYQLMLRLAHTTLGGAPAQRRLLARVVSRAHRTLRSFRSANVT